MTNTSRLMTDGLGVVGRLKLMRLTFDVLSCVAHGKMAAGMGVAQIGRVGVTQTGQVCVARGMTGAVQMKMGSVTFEGTMGLAYME